jgi:hypothetical protein
LKTITFDRFEIGIDHRKGKSVSDANRLRVLKNGYITTGKVVKKRPGITLISDFNTLGEVGSKGLASYSGSLVTFYDKDEGPVTHSNSLLTSLPLVQVDGGGYASNLEAIHYADPYYGFEYVVAEFADGTYQHHWIELGPFDDIFSIDFATESSMPSVVSDSNCPNTTGVVKQDDRIFAVNDDTIRYTDPTTATGDGKDWSDSLGNPFFLGTGVKATGSVDAVGLGQYQGRLAVFFKDGTQIWDLDIAGSADAFYKAVEGVGTRYPRSIKSFAGDILFLSKAGFRSITTQATTENMYDVDVGSPIDNLVRPDLTTSLRPISGYFTGLGQYWCFYATPTNKTRVWVYTFSRTMKISAWSEYEFDFVIDDITLHDGSVYFRAGEKVYLIDETDAVWDHDGNDIAFSMEMAYLDFKKPGSLKYIASMDIVVQGSIAVQFRYDPDDETKITDPITLTGDTRPEQSIPVEITTTGLAPVFTSTNDELVQIDMIQFHYDELEQV